LRAVIQRVTRSSVTVVDEVTGSTELGLMILIGVTHDDAQEDIDYIAEKSVNMRLFPKETDESGFDRSILEVGGSALLVSQFTLYASTRKGRRPSFTEAAPGDVSEPIFDQTVAAFQERGVKVTTGVFGAYMHVDLINDGPVTILLDSDDRKTPRKQAD
jgi:D-tyrosyl-tRNA(Tyr) deacylase